MGPEAFKVSGLKFKDNDFYNSQNPMQILECKFTTLCENTQEENKKREDYTHQKKLFRRAGFC
jgi:hypothetical protein